MPRLRLPRISGGRPRRRVAAGLALIAAVAVVVVIILSAGSSAPANAGANPAVSGAATVQRRNLVETDTEAGTLSYSNPQTVYNRLSGTITWLPNAGQVIRPGGTLFRVNGEPVILMNGTTPAYRDLSPSDTDGPDITELNRNLVALGFNPDGIVVDDVWQPATTAGVELFQESLGQTATGTLSLGQVVFLPGTQLISTVEGTLGSTGAASTTVDPPAPEFVSLDTRVSCPTTTTTSTTPCSSTPPTTTTPTTGSHRHHKSKGSTSKQTLAALIALLRAEIAQLQAERGSSSGTHNSSGANSSSGSKSSNGSSGKGSSGSGSSGSGSSGSGSAGSGSSGDGSSGSGGGGSATAILQTTSTQLVVTVDLSASVQSEAVVGEHVTVEMPSGRFVNGTVTAVSSVAQSSSDNGNGNGNGGGGDNGNGNGNGNGGSGSSSTIPVTITLSGHVSGVGLDQAAVSVNFAEAKANNVLSVPVTALLATPGGNYAVQEATPPHKLIPVTTGLFAAGDVQISGPGIYEGLQVTDSQG